MKLLIFISVYTAFLMQLVDLYKIPVRPYSMSRISSSSHLRRLSNDEVGDGIEVEAPSPSVPSMAVSTSIGVSSSSSSIPSVIAEGSGNPCRIKVIGVGGGGGNAVNRMMESGDIDGVELWAVNTDSQALCRALAPNTLKIGDTTSRGLGAGGNPAVGNEAAEENREDIMKMVSDADLVFVTAGMGGGTGSGAAPVVAECAKKSGALTVGVVTKPFSFEGKRRSDQAKKAIAEMRDKVDTLIVVSNDKLLRIVPDNTPLSDAFLVADDILRQGVVGISEIIIKPGLVNVDFADVRAIMGNAGTALMGIGQGKGKDRAKDAALAAISSPLLDFPIAKAKGIVFNIVGGSDMTLQEINSAAQVIYDNVDLDANIIFGALVDDKMMNNEIAITVLATGFATDFFGDAKGQKAIKNDLFDEDDTTTGDSQTKDIEEEGDDDVEFLKSRRSSRTGGFRRRVSGLINKIFG